MAKSINNENIMSEEEKVEMALVPDIEQSYTIPANWCWTRIKYLCLLKNGRAFKPTDWSQVGLPIIRIQNLNDPENEYNYFDGQVSDDHRLYGEELLFAWSGTPGTSFGAHIWRGKDAVLNQHIFRVDFDEQYIHKQYFMYAINQQLDMLISSAHGGAGLQHVTKGIFESTPIALAPYSEQKRIVDRIESLFAKLDEAKEKAQAVVDGFEDRKAAILQKAFSGELTELWRKKNKRESFDWITSCLKDCCIIGSGGTPSRKEPQNYDGNIPWIKTGEINWNEIYDSEEHISESAIENSSAKVYPIGAVLVAMYGMGVTRGRASILRIAAATNQAVCVLQPNNTLLNRYLFYFFMCNYWGIREKAVGGSQLNLSATIIGKLQIQIPPIEEQKEIVAILDNILAKDAIEKEIVEQALNNIESMKKSILARAFRGVLGTNDPTDESAVELLKRVLQEDV